MLFSCEKQVVPQSYSRPIIGIQVRRWRAEYLLLWIGTSFM